MMKFLKMGASALLWAAATVATAQEAPAIPLTLTPTSASTLGVSFERSVSGLFIDVFSFTPASVAGTVSVTLTPLTNSVNFFAALLGDEGFSFYPESGATNFSFQSIVDSTRPLSLTVFGYAGDANVLTDAAGRYSGAIAVTTVAAVPEPETYALLTAGLLVLGAWRRRRHRAA